ncbi:MAG: DNA topoisomerase I [Candidatus Nanoarchaeia archaeon]|jgi:DNA topoisomerase-1
MAESATPKKKKAKIESPASAGNTELIITEKPSTAEKISNALAEGKMEKTLFNKKVPFYRFLHGGKNIIVTSAVGHLYTLAEKNKKGWTYPVFDVEWRALGEVSKSAAYSSVYLNAIKSLVKEADTFTIATDFDVEGEVIGFNILRFLCKVKDARRMKFSTTTKEDLLEAYQNVHPHIEHLQAEAGVTRHELDYYYGINLSRALTLSIKAASGMFKILSSGRVQGPALKIIADRENAIKAFVPVPFWQIQLLADGVDAWHEADKFWEKPKADAAFANAKKGKPAVSKIDANQFDQMPPHPFDLTALQMEAYRQFGISPKETLEIAQSLYVNSYISYPRTSSNQLPAAIGYKKIITKLSKMFEYEEICKILLAKKELFPNNGTKTDPAHPALYFTGETPKDLDERQTKIFDLIVRRTLASFGDKAKRETVSVEIDSNGEKFIAQGTRTIEEGWHKFYGPYAKFEEKEMPALKVGQQLKVDELNLHDRETSPPKRYTAASIIKALETKGLGTKATRSEIVDNLYKRNYARNTAIETTELGLAIVTTLLKYCPEILDEKLTRKFEKEMEMIKENKKKGEEVLGEARTILTKVLAKFKANEKAIGEGLSEATKITRDQETVVGVCPNCGGNLRILFSKRFKSYFIACNKYPNCKTTYSLTYGLPKPTDKKCPECGFPLVLIIRAGKRPFEFCFNRLCPKRLEWKKQQEEKKQEEAKGVIAHTDILSPKETKVQSRKKAVLPSENVIAHADLLKMPSVEVKTEAKESDKKVFAPVTKKYEKPLKKKAVKK